MDVTKFIMDSVNVVGAIDLPGGALNGEITKNIVPRSSGGIASAVTIRVDDSGLVVSDDIFGSASISKDGIISYDGAIFGNNSLLIDRFKNTEVYCSGYVSLGVGGDFCYLSEASLYLLILSASICMICGNAPRTKRELLLLDGLKRENIISASNLVERFNGLSWGHAIESIEEFEMAAERIDRVLDYLKTNNCTRLNTGIYRNFLAKIQEDDVDKIIKALDYYKNYEDVEVYSALDYMDDIFAATNTVYTKRNIYSAKQMTKRTEDLWTYN